MESAKPEKEKKPKKDIVIPPKKPKLSKAERRALQESQRAAKAEAADGGNASKKSSQLQQQSSPSDGNEANEKKNGNGNGNGNGASSDENMEGSSRNDTLTFFSHLPPYKDHRKIKDFSGVKLSSSSNSNLHPAVHALGLQYADGSIRGANSRCKAMFKTFQKVIQDYTLPLDTKKDYRQDLENRVLKPSFTYWTTKCRIHSVTMGNAFTFLKLAVANLGRDMVLEDVKSILCEGMDAYIHERIDFADVAICKYGSSKIMNGDVILTYAKNELIQMLLSNLDREKKKIRVILVDSRPLLEGKDMLQELMDAGVECTYILLNSLSYVMKEVTKVFLGASALMSDGSVLSRVGTATVAMMARSHNVPVLVCCETFKISNRVQLESITGNELGDPDDLMPPSLSLEEWKSSRGEHLRLVNLLYDLTPNEFVSGIVTEMGILPPTSVAVLLREMNPQDSGFKEEEF